MKSGELSLKSVKWISRSSSRFLPAMRRIWRIVRREKRDRVAPSDRPRGTEVRVSSFGHHGRRKAGLDGMDLHLRKVLVSIQTVPR